MQMLQPYLTCPPLPILAKHSKNLGAMTSVLRPFDWRSPFQIPIRPKRQRLCWLGKGWLGTLRSCHGDGEETKRITRQMDIYYYCFGTFPTWTWTSSSMMNWTGVPDADILYFFHFGSDTLPDCGMNLSIVMHIHMIVNLRHCHAKSFIKIRVRRTISSNIGWSQWKKK